MAIDHDPNTIARDETHDLISSEKVDGTAVFNRQGDKLGSIHHFMVGKRDGRVRYAVLSFGGLFGMGERYYPLPWDVLTYDTDMGGYVVDLDKSVLEGAPSFERDDEPAYDREFGERVYGHYGLTY
ncbi:MAG: PRC-barrel domain-containing protein [Pseudomonadota bacterium]|nr:PRC-barrel domain-containing protein [Pseudomonadota bacterium]